MNRPSLALCALILGLASTSLGSSAVAVARDHFGAPLANLTGLRGPQAAAFAADGGLWVADTGRHRVVGFDAYGSQRIVIGARGRADAQFLRPGGVACAADGRLFVADTGNDRVQVFAADGAWLHSFGARGRGAGELCEPRGLCLDAQRVLVADTGNARIAVFTLAGEPLPDLPQNVALQRPVAVALDPLARVWVADALACRVVRLDPRGAEALVIGGRGEPFGLLADPQGIGFLGARLFVSDRYNHRVQEFDPAGTFVGSFPGAAFAPHADAGRLFAPAGLATAPGADRIAVCEPLEDRVQIFGQAKDVPGADAHDDQASGLDGSLVRVGEGAEGDGQIVVWVDPQTRSVRVQRDGEIGLSPLTRLGARGGMGVDLIDPRDAAIDSRRHWIHVSDAGRICTLLVPPETLDGGYDPLTPRLVRAIELPSRADSGPLSQLEWPCEPGALAVLQDGGLLVADERNRALVRFTPDGRVSALWTTFGGESLGRPVEIVCFGERVYVSDADRGQVLVLDGTGALLGRLAHTGDEPLGTPSGILPLADGRVLVADRERDRVHVFDGSGARVSVWGASGTGPGELHQPTALFGAPEGLLRVIDCGNRRGQVLSTDGRFVLSF